MIRREKGMWEWCMQGREWRNMEGWNYVDGNCLGESRRCRWRKGDSDVGQWKCWDDDVARGLGDDMKVIWDDDGKWRAGHCYGSSSVSSCCLVAGGVAGSESGRWDLHFLMGFVPVLFVVREETEVVGYGGTVRVTEKMLVSLSRNRKQRRSPSLTG